MIGLKGLPVRKDSGGVERHVEELASRLVQAGLDVLAYVRPRHTHTRKSECRGIRLQRMPSIPTKSLDTLTHTLLSSLSVLFKKVDIIHYHGIGPSTLAWIPRLFKPRSRVVVTFHSIDRFHQKWGPLARAYLRFAEWTALRYPHATIAVSRSIQGYCREHYGSEPTYIPNGATVRSVHPGRDRLKEWSLEPDGYILTVARLVRQKGIHHLIEAYGRLKTDKKLVIAGAAGFGTGEYAAYLRDLSRGNSSVVFTGFQSGESLAQLYANAYLYVHPSEAEGLSVSILEAMSYGRCVLVSDIPENLESIDHSGLTFHNADPDDLAERLTALLNHPEIVRERGERARKWVSWEYDWGTIADRTAALYLDLLMR